MANYNPNDAAAFNKALQSGLSTADAAKQAGITPAAAAQYALGSNNNLGSQNPGVAATPATEKSTFATQAIPQTASGQPAQGVQLASAAKPAASPTPFRIEGILNRDGTITFIPPTAQPGPVPGAGNGQATTPGPASQTPVAPSDGGRGTGLIERPIEQAPPLTNNTVTPVDVTKTSLSNQPPAAAPATPAANVPVPVFNTPGAAQNGQGGTVPVAAPEAAPSPTTFSPTDPRVTAASPVPAVGGNGQAPAPAVTTPSTGSAGPVADELSAYPPPTVNNQVAAPAAEPVIDELSAYPPPTVNNQVAAKEPFRVEVVGPGFVQAPGEQGRGTAAPEPVLDELSAYPPNPKDQPNDRRMNDADYINSLETASNKNNTIQQATLQSTYKQPGNGDWRFRISLAEGANYLYKASSSAAGAADGSDKNILAPLATTNGVVFPYTPSVTTSYQAKYNTYDLVHSNYRGVFYQGSGVSEISVRGVFTAQDTSEAAYLLAVIHFFRSVTKMFYGQDEQRGAPPPLVYLTGLGDYQFNAHPAVVTNFEYSLPSDVDYIRANNPNNFGTDLLNRRAGVLSPPSNPLSAIATRLGLSGLFPNAVASKPSYGPVTNSVTNTAKATYVPTKIDINISLLPVQTRDQVSKQFSLKEFATGKLIQGGFW